MNFKDKNNLIEFKAFQKKVLKKYKLLINDYICKNYKKAAILVYWLNDYIEYLKTESTFNPNQNITYKRGQIVYVNFGYRIGKEIGGAHYAVVIDVKNAAKNPLVTVAPLKSNKNKNTPYYNIYTATLKSDLKSNLVEKAESIIDTNFLQLLKVAEKLEQASEKEKIKLLTQDGARIKRRTKFARDILSYVEKLKDGSIVDLGQITSISKQRIIHPCKKDDILTDIKLSEEDMSLIDEKIRRLYLNS